MNERESEGTLLLFDQTDTGFSAIDLIDSTVRSQVLDARWGDL